MNRKLIAALATAALVVGCIVAVVRVRRPAPRPRRRFTIAQLMEAAKDQTARDAHLSQAWAPVSAAIKSGNVAQVEKAFGGFQKQVDPVADGIRARVAAFYMEHQAVDDARVQLDLIVHPRSTVGSRNYDARTCLMWLQCNPQFTNAERTATIDLWAREFRATQKGEAALPELGSEALLQFKAGQSLIFHITTRRDAIKHYREALRLAPDSMMVARSLVAALLEVGQNGDAKLVAVETAPQLKSEADRQELLTEGHVEPDKAQFAVP